MFWLLLACGDDPDVLLEGDDPAECTDGADNDADGLYDCNDEGCANSADCVGATDGLRDITLDYGPLEGDLNLFSPLYTIPPYTDIEHCYFVTYTGPDVAFTKGISYQHPDFGHHAVIQVGDPGVTYDMTGIGSDCYKAMVDFQWHPIIELVGAVQEGIGYGDYPEGMGYHLRSGTTIMLQSHHLNSSDEPLLVNDRFDMHFEDLDEVDYVAAPIEVGDDYFEITPGVFEHSFECQVDEAFNLAWISGHMHEWGKYQYIDLIKPSGESMRIYEVENWLDEYYFASPIADFLPQGVAVDVGDKIRVTCAWDNDTGETIYWPDEMCYSMGIIFPHSLGFVCNANGD